MDSTLMNNDKVDNGATPAIYDNYRPEYQSDREVHYRLREALAYINDTVGATFGPEGKLALVYGGEQGLPYLTKDGVTVFQNLQSNDQYVNSIISIIREASEKTAKEAGDGTTTTALMTMEMIAKPENDGAVSDMIKAIQSNKNSISGIEDVYKIALASTNNDEVAAGIVRDAYEYSDNVVFEKKSGVSETTCLEETGSKFYSTYLDRTFITKHLHLMKLDKIMLS